MKSQVLRHEEFTRTLYIHLGSVDLCTIPVPCEQGKDTCVPPVSRQWCRVCLLHEVVSAHTNHSTNAQGLVKRTPLCVRAQQLLIIS